MSLFVKTKDIGIFTYIHTGAYLWVGGKGVVLPPEPLRVEVIPL